jgi:adenylate cyclase
MDDLLEGLDGDARDSRARLLERLREDGVPEEELRRAAEEDRLALLPIERVLAGEPRHTTAQLAERSGLPLEWLRRARRAMGLSLPPPDEVAFTDQDLEAARRLRTYLDAGLPEEELLGGMRVLGSSLARSAEVIRAVTGRALMEAGIGEDELARRFGDSARALMPLMAADLDYLLRVHMREIIRQDAISHAELRAGELSETVETAVAFADLVGFTALGQEAEAEVLGDVAARLLEHTEEVVAPPVRLVKTIGDAVMLVAPQPEPLLAALLDLIDAVEDDGDLPPLRAGVALGQALQRLGDLYGGTVNIAARLCARARPGAVLATVEVHDAAPERFAWSHAGPKKLKGLATLDTWRARRPEPG